MAKKKKAEVGKPTRTSPAGFVWDGEACTNPCRVTFGEARPVDILFAENPDGETWEFGVEWRTDQVEQSRADAIKSEQCEFDHAELLSEAVHHVGAALGAAWSDYAQYILTELDKLNLQPGAVHDLSGIFPLPAPAPEPVVERVIMRQERRQLRCTLTEAETMAKAKRAADLHIEITRLTEDKKRIAKDFDAKIEAAESEVSNISNAIASGYELREIDCDVYLCRPDPDHKKVIRRDSNSLECVELMNPRDRQLTLDEVAK